MSKSPEDDTASQAMGRGKTRASQMLRETDGGQEQVEGRKKKEKRKRQHKGVGRKRKPSTLNVTEHDAPR